LTLVGPPLTLCRVWCTWQAPAGWSHRPAHWQCLSRSRTALRIPAGMVSLYPMSKGRLGPASGLRAAGGAGSSPSKRQCSSICAPGGRGIPLT
jgi:hypothetical protein